MESSLKGFLMHTASAVTRSNAHHLWGTLCVVTFCRPTWGVTGTVLRGDGALVGANAVDTHHVPAESIAVDVPARSRTRRTSAERNSLAPACSAEPRR
jgi:hypothetical protein